jgi:hypothetical protein
MAAASRATSITRGSTSIWLDVDRSSSEIRSLPGSAPTSSL